jgi:hypothetical protein
MRNFKDIENNFDANVAKGYAYVNAGMEFIWEDKPIPR